MSDLLWGQWSMPTKPGSFTSFYACFWKLEELLVSEGFHLCFSQPPWTYHIVWRYLPAIDSEEECWHFLLVSAFLPWTCACDIIIGKKAGGGGGAAAFQWVCCSDLQTLKLKFLKPHSKVRGSIFMVTVKCASHSPPPSNIVCRQPNFSTSKLCKSMVYPLPHFPTSPLPLFPLSLHS